MFVCYVCVDIERDSYFVETGIVFVYGDGEGFELERRYKNVKKSEFLFLCVDTERRVFCVDTVTQK